MTAHRPRRSWLRLGVWRCACGRQIGHRLLAQDLAGMRIPDGDVVPVNGYRRSSEALMTPRNGGWWPR
jgi:hypothetical protein